MASDQFVIDGICHPYNFSEENLKGRFGRIFNDMLDRARRALAESKSGMFRTIKRRGLETVRGAPNAGG